MTNLQTNSSELEHGLSAYSNGKCRCDICRAAWAAYQRVFRRRRKLPTDAGSLAAEFAAEFHVAGEVLSAAPGFEAIVSEWLSEKYAEVAGITAVPSPDLVREVTARSRGIFTNTAPDFDEVPTDINMQDYSDYRQRHNIGQSSWVEPTRVTIDRLGQM